jgi:hypothetical protein
MAWFTPVIAALAAVIHGVSTVVSKAWSVTKEFMSWLIALMPKPMRFFFFLYFILFVTALIMPKFLGAGFACDTQGQAYRMNFFKLMLTTEDTETLSVMCESQYTGQPVTVTGGIDFSLSGLADMLRRLKATVLSLFQMNQIVHGLESGDYSEAKDATEMCEHYRTLVLTNQSTPRDLALMTFGEKLTQSDYENIVHIGCSQDSDGDWYTSLNLYSLDLFNFEMWLMIGIFGALVPFCLKWYRLIR